MTIHHFTPVIITASLIKKFCAILPVFLAGIVLYVCPGMAFIPLYL